MVHEHEGWQLQVSWPVADVETQRLGKLPLVAAGELAMAAHRDG